jgi:hypothetical protein
VSSQKAEADARAETGEPRSENWDLGTENRELRIENPSPPPGDGLIRRAYEERIYA